MYFYQSPMPKIVLRSAENKISTFWEQQSVLTLTFYLWFSSNIIISFILRRLLKTINRNHKRMRDPRKAENEYCEKGKTYFSTNCTRFTNSSSEQTMSKKSSITVVRTPFLATIFELQKVQGKQRLLHHRSNSKFASA